MRLLHDKSILILTVLLPELSTAWSLPTFDFLLPFTGGAQLPFETATTTNDVNDGGATVKPLRIAIIGAGAAGSSAAFWISKAKERHEQDVHVDIYEQEDYIGGRSTIAYPYNDTSLRWTELGASILVEVNRNMMRAAKEFNLTLAGFDSEADNEMGIWDGKQIVLNVNGNGWSSWFDNVKLWWRYGYASLRKAPKIVDTMVETIKELYTPSFKTWTSVESLAKSVNWLQLTSQTAMEFMTSQGVGELFIHELQEGATRVNYGQNSDEIHALMGAVSMATTGAVGVHGGNYQIFDQFIKRSGAKVHFNTKVTGLRKSTVGTESPKWLLSVASGTSSSGDNAIPAYDHVILASPFASSQITILGSPASTTLNQPPVEYVHLHVTLLTTTSPTFSPTYFGLKEGSKVPSMMLTTWDGVRHGVAPEPEFNSINYLNQIKTVEKDGVDEWTVKVFSKESISDEWLEKMFGAGNVGWVYRKEWDAYAKGKPTTEFPPIHPDTGLWYINGFESLISTMETETLASRNVIDQLFQSQFAAGICPPDAELSLNSEAENDDGEAEPNKGGKEGWGGTGAEGLIYGWDC